MTNVVVVGAGFAGVLTAKYLEQKLGKEKDVCITLIDKNDYHTMRTEIHAAATSRGKSTNIIYPLADIYKGKNVNLVKDTVSKIDFGAKKVIGTDGCYEYDYLVLSAGSQPAYFGIPGAKENTLPFWTFDDALDIKTKLSETFENAAKLADADERKAALSFYVVGAGLTGVELAGELAEVIPLLCEKYSVDKNDTSVTVLDAAARAIPNLPAHRGNTATKILTEMGCEMIFNAKVKEVKPDAIVYEVNGTEVCKPKGMAVWSAGITANDVTLEAAKELKSERGGRIVDNYYLESVTDPSVYVCGDNMYYVPKGKKGTVPQMVENCEQASKIVANNIANKITGEGKQKTYKPSLHGCMVSLGAKKGLTYFILGPLAIPLPSLPTQIFKRAINIVYLAPVIGFSKLPTLINREYLAKRNLKNK